MTALVEMRVRPSEGDHKGSPMRTNLRIDELFGKERGNLVERLLARPSVSDGASDERTSLNLLPLASLLPRRGSLQGQALTGAGRGRRTTQGVPTPHLIHSRPYGDEGACEATSPHTSP